MSGALANTAAC